MPIATFCRSVLFLASHLSPPRIFFFVRRMVKTFNQDQHFQAHASWDYFHAQLEILENGFLCVLCPITSIGLPSFPTMYNIIVFLAKVLEKFGLEYNLTRFFFSKISAKIWCFFGFKHNFHQHLMYVAYTCHTWMESCVSQQHFGTKMLGLAYVIRV